MGQSRETHSTCVFSCTCMGDRSGILRLMFLGDMARRQPWPYSSDNVCRSSWQAPCGGLSMESLSVGHRKEFNRADTGCAEEIIDGEELTPCLVADHR